MQSICTVANETDWTDLQLLLNSISTHSSNIIIFICATPKLIELLVESELSDGRIQIKIVESEGNDDKNNIIDVALSFHTNTLYVSPNTIFLKSPNLLPINKENIVAQTIDCHGETITDFNTMFISNKENRETMSSYFSKEHHLTWQDICLNDEKSVKIDEIIVARTYFSNKYDKDVMLQYYNKYIKSNETKKEESKQEQQEKGISLLLQYCNVLDEERQQEYDYCFEANLTNPHIEYVYNFKEDKTTVPEKFRNHPKYKEIQWNRWLRYSDAFNFANKFLPYKTVCLANLDIFLDHSNSWQTAAEIVKQNIVLCLSRFEFNAIEGTAKKDENLGKLKFCNCQDAWVFRSPIHINMTATNFEIGRLGCDNAIADRLKKAEYSLLNNSSRFKIFHYDVCRGKNGSNFLSKTKEDDLARNLKQQHPEEQGQYLVPDIDSFVSANGGSPDISLDMAAKFLGLNTFQKYEIMCDMFTQNIKIDNRKKQPTTQTQQPTTQTQQTNTTQPPTTQPILYGTDYGGFYLPSELKLDDKSIIYCVGVGEDISLDVALAAKTKAPIYMFDPTVRAEEHTRLIKKCFEDNTKPQSSVRYGGGDIKYVDMLFKEKIDPNQLKFYPLGLYTEDTTLKFYAPTNKEFVSYTLEKELRPENFDDYIHVEVKTLKTLMKKLNHSHIDFLKIDIEGVECEVLIQMIENKIYPTYLCVDFDARRANKKIDLFNKAVELLQKNGYSVYANDNLDVTFIRTN